MSQTDQSKAPGLLSIGEFARRSRLTLKALRLYDAMGLLQPVWTDPDSGYRHYSPEQLGAARLIGLLRQLEMPLQAIAEVLGLRGAEAAQAVARWWAGVEGDLKTKRRLVHYLEDYLGGKGEAMYEVKTREVPEQKVLTLQRNVYVKDLSPFIGEAFGQIEAHLRAAGLKASGPGLVIYHGEVNNDSDGPVEVCVPFEGSAEPAGAIAVRLEAPHREAYTRLTKAQVEFPSILKAYDAVSDWLKASGLFADRCSPREVYFADWDTIGPDDPACDIAFPYRA